MTRHRIASRLAAWLLPAGCAVALLCESAGGALAADVIDNTIQPIVTLRDSGYLLGDLVDEQVELTLPAGFNVDADSLPLPGRVAPWMEVRHARIEAGQAPGQTSVVVTYQVFAEVEQAERVPIPPFKLRVRDGVQARAVNVPEKSFLMSPALPATLTDEDRELKPSSVPQALPLARTISVFALSVLAVMAFGLYLLWAYDRLPFLPRSPGPFARAWRRWRRTGVQVRWAGARVPWRPWMAVSGPRGPWMAESGRRSRWWPSIAEKGRRGRHPISESERIALLRDWHAALNQTAGETLYTSTLPQLFARAPYLEALRTQVEGMFDASWKSFYGVSQSPGPGAAEILDLLRRSAERERGVPC
jgi:mxaA protein